MQSSIRLVLIACFLLTPFAASNAHDGASGATKARMDAMSDMGRALKRLSLAARDNALANNPEMEQPIDMLKQGADSMAALFEPREIPHVSEALPAIWDDPEAFGASITQYVNAVERLGVAFESNDAAAARATLRDVNRACSGCHQAFRK